MEELTLVKKKKYPIIPKSCACPALRGKDLKVKETILPALKKRFTPTKQLIKGPMVFYRILVSQRIFVEHLLCARHCSRI